jgi:hypothetical protein
VAVLEQLLGIDIELEEAEAEDVGSRPWFGESVHA